MKLLIIQIYCQKFAAQSSVSNILTGLVAASYMTTEVGRNSLDSQSGARYFTLLLPVTAYWQVCLLNMENVTRVHFKNGAIVWYYDISKYGPKEKL